MDEPTASDQRPKVWVAVLVGVALLATAFWALETGHAWVNILLAVGVVAVRISDGLGQVLHVQQPKSGASWTAAPSTTR